MNISTYSKAFKSKAINVGFSEESISKCLNYAQVLVENGVPIIYNLTHLSKLVGIERNYIVQAAVSSKYSDAYYRYYNIKKKNGKGFRKIMEPLPNLKVIQYWILENILETIKPSAYAKAYIKKRGLKQNIRFHVNQKIVLSLDIKDFFPSINFSDVESVFRGVGYSNELSNYLAKLCCLEEELPQGAPTSPYLSNLIFSNVDSNIANYCKANDIRYTRYADDLTFSGDFDNDALIKYIDPLLNDNGFELNKAKSKLMLRSNRQIVTGIIVNDKPQLDKETRRSIRQEVHYIKTFGLESHMERIKVNSSYYLNNLIGRISFGLYINPKDDKLKEYHKLLTELYKKRN